MFQKKFIANASKGKIISCFKHIKYLEVRWKSTYFLTTPIFYVNAGIYVGLINQNLLKNQVFCLI